MENSLFDLSGRRKYLVARERLAFATAALRQDRLAAGFCLTLAVIGARISEVLALTPDRIDASNGAIIFETLKRRQCGVFRAVPVPRRLQLLLAQTNHPPTQRIWPWCRTTAWKVVKSVMRDAKIAEALCQPKALRHAFAIEAGQQGVPLNIIQRWLGHARIETTAIYASALGREERRLAQRAWRSVELVMPLERPGEG
jgi:site-specific recombinase XerD